MAKISANNIQIGAITSDKLDSSVASGLATADNANTIATIATSVASAAFASANTNAAILANVSSPLITTIQIADSSYNVLDDTAANTTGGYVVITGSGFTNSSTVVFGSTSAPAVSYVDSTTLRAQVPALTAASYPVYVVNSNGGTGIKINGLTTSSFPAWSTGAALANTAANTVFSVSLSANSDSNITYANTSALPAGTTLAANGYFSGTISIGTQTTYTFDVKATDVENQDAARTFSLTVTVTPLYTLWSAGLSNYGGFNENYNYRSSPAQVGALTNWSSLSGAGVFLLGIKTDGTLWGWGASTQGALGQNNTITQSSPVQVGSQTGWDQAVAGSQTIARKTDGTLWAWGRNSLGGTLGLNDIIDRSSPVQVGTSTDWGKIANNGGLNAGFNVVITKTNGTLWTWGRNQAGQLGQNNLIERSSPTQVGALTNWLSTTGKLSNGTGHVLAIKSDGTLWSWGSNTNGQLGLNLNGTTYKSSPTQVGTGTTWFGANAGYYTSMAVKTDGTLWAWGRNTAGQLGLNDRVYRSSPVQVGTQTNWAGAISGLGAGAVGIKTNGTLWAWGNNLQGQLGLNDKVDRSSPTQVGTSTNWPTSMDKVTITYALVAIREN